jgi:hypothetical protein
VEKGYNITVENIHKCKKFWNRIGFRSEKKAYMTNEDFQMGRLHCFEALAWQDTKKTPSNSIQSMEPPGFIARFDYWKFNYRINL